MMPIELQQMPARRTTRRKRVTARVVGVLCILALMGIALTTLINAAFPGIMQ